MPMNGAVISPLLTLVDLIRRAQKAENQDELAFLVVNDTHLLLPYRQAALWFVEGSIRTLSGVVQVEANAPYALWLSNVCNELIVDGAHPRIISKEDLSLSLAVEWSEWLPSFALWLPLLTREKVVVGSLLLSRDDIWVADEIDLLYEWVSSWYHAWGALNTPKQWSLLKIKQSLINLIQPVDRLPWWKQPRFRLGLFLSVCLFFPVRLSVLAPSELVPSNPVLIRAPLDGVIGQFSVKPNEPVKSGQLLFDFEEATLLSRRDVARQVLATAEAEYRQQVQQALSDSKAKAQLTVLIGRISEKHAEAEFVEGQVSRSHVLAPQSGIALFDDPSEWVGRPVQTGERIMRIADPDAVEVEAWVAVGDAVPIAVGSPLSLYLNASPLFSLAAKVRYMSHDAVQRPDGSFAYRVRAKLISKTSHRIGLKGTARLNGEHVPLIYWIIRRPLAVIRQTIGW